MRYSAFISYNHADKGWATWLHRALETHRLPRRLKGRPSPFGPLGARLPPVFRDRDELKAAPGLAQALAAALAEAETLIVVCSPQAAASRWVNEEIREFIRLGRAERIYCLIVGGGEPGDLRPYLPPALLENGRGEPLAADVRKDKDGRGGALLKLIAAILGLNYDELRQREAIRRHHQLAAISVASLAGLVFTSGLAIFALISRGEAVRQRELADQRATTAERTVGFVKSLFEVSDPSVEQGDPLTARQVLDRGARQIQGGLNNEPAVKAELGVTLGEVYLSLGLFPEGDQLIRQTLQLRHGQASVTAEQLLALAEDQFKRDDVNGAIATNLAAIALARRSPDVGPELVGRMYEQLAVAQSAAGQKSAAGQAAERALAIDRGRKPQDPSDVARDLEALGENQMDLLQWAAAREDFEQALALRRQAEGQNSPSVADNLNSLGDIAYALGDLGGAENDYRQVVDIDKIVFAPDHPDVAVALNNLARLMVDRREFAPAEPLLERAIDINVKRRSADNGDMSYVYGNLGLAERGLGKSAQAQALLQKAYAIADRAHHRMRAPLLAALADMRCDAGDVEGGVKLLETARPIMLADYPGVAWRTAWLDNVLGACLMKGPDKAAARRLIETSTPAVLSQWGPGTLYGEDAARRLRSARDGV
jgi:tetratricopeptide (TPR) repeat protein